MMSRYERALTGLLVAGLMAAPAISASAAKKKPAPKKPAPKKPAPAKGDVKAGLAAFKSEGCTGCHKTKDYKDAGNVGPDLSKVGAEHTAAEIAKYTQQPKSGSIMPAFKGPAKTLQDMAAYLATQK